MKRMRIFTVLAGLTSATVMALAIPAQAAEGSWTLTIEGCTGATEQIQLQGSPAHDYMRWSATCGNGAHGDIIDLGQSGAPEIENWAFNSNSSHTTAWYYDGPGHDLEACVTGTTGQMACGPDN